MKRLTLFLFGLVCLPSCALHFSDFVLVAKDTPPAPIVVFEGAPPRTRDAAESLANYIEKISGQKPEIIEGEPSPLPERAIWVGVQPAVKSLFPKTDFDFQHPEETLILANDSHLVIAGRDRWDPAHMEAKGRLAMKTGMQQEYGTANAVYTFLHDHLGVRWLWPGEEDLVMQERITIAPCELRYHPQFRARASIFTKLELGDHKEGDDLAWARFQRTQLDSMEFPGGHGFPHWWDQYGGQHPEYFAAAPDGTRKAFSDPNYTKLCASNPAVWEQWLEEVEEKLRTNPMQRIFPVTPNDGYTSGHCTCANCLAWDHPDGEKMEWNFGGGVKFQGVSQTDRDVRFANTLADLLKKRFPDKELYVKLGAYGLARNPPLGVKPDDNVIIASVANFAMRSNDEREKPIEQHTAWSQLTKHIMWRPNLGNPCGLTWGLPDVPITQLAGDFRFAADTRCTGVFFDMLWYHWSTQGPMYYALSHLAWNPRADADAIMNDYYLRCYGPAAQEMKDWWQFWERARMEFVNANPNRFRAFEMPEKYTPGLFAEARRMLDAADAKLAGADEKYRRRLEFARCGFEFTQAVMDIRSAMSQFEASNKKDDAAKARVLAGWERVNKMKTEFPKWAINWNAVMREPGPEPGEKRNKRLEGLHPNTPISARTLRMLNAPGLE